MVMSFAQFTDRSGLRDIETTLNLCGDLCRSGIKVMPKSTLTEANEKKDWRIYQDFAMTFVKEATALYKDEKLRIGLVPSLHSISNSIGQALFRRADIRELYNQQTLPVNVPEAEAVEQLTLW